MPCAMAASNRSCGWRDSLDRVIAGCWFPAVLLLLIVRSPVALVLVALVSTSVASTSLEALPTSVFPVLPSASLANALLTVELLTAIPLAAASVLSAEVLVVALPASVLGVCDEVLSSLGLLAVPCHKPLQNLPTILHSPVTAPDSGQLNHVPRVHLKCQYTAYDTRPSPISHTRVVVVNAFRYSLEFYSSVVTSSKILRSVGGNFLKVLRSVMLGLLGVSQRTAKGRTYGAG